MNRLGHKHSAQRQAQQKAHETDRNDPQQKTATGRADDRISSRCENLQDNSASPCNLDEWSRGESNPRPVSVQGSTDNDLRDASNAGGAESGAVPPISTPNDPDLTRLIDAWPTLPEAIKAGILAMVTAAGER